MLDRAYGFQYFVIPSQGPMTSILGPLLSLPVIIGAACTFLAYFLVKNLLIRRLPLPPGPRGVPILGNIFDIPRRDEWKAYQTWGVELGGSLSDTRQLSL